MAEIYIYPGPKKKPRKRVVILTALAAIALLAALALYVAGSWGPDHAPGWLLTERSHRSGDRTLTFDALPTDQYQDAVARALVAELGGRAEERGKYFSDTALDLLPQGRELRVTALDTGAGLADQGEGRNLYRVTVAFGGGERLSLAVGRTKDGYQIMGETPA